MGLLTFRNLQMSQAGVYSSGGPTPPASPPGYGQVYNTSAQNINNDATITFDSNGPLLNISHVAGSDTITINATGTYLITWIISAQGDGGAYTLLHNGVAVPTLSYVTDPSNGETVGNGIVNLSSGDTIQLRNNTGFLLALQTQAGFVNASITFEKMISSGASSGTTTLAGNLGSATEVGGIINVVTNNSTVLFSGAGNTLDLDFGLSNLGIGSSYPSLIGGSQNTSLGDLALHSVTAGVSNTAVGYNTMVSVTSGQANTAVGEAAGSGLTTQNHNTAIGATALEQAACADATAVGSNALGILTSGDQNTAIGSGALSALGTGANNIALGFDAGVNLTTNESSTILIGNAGVILDNNTVRIGTQGAGAGQQNKSFMAGIRGTTSGSTDRYPVNIDVNGQFDGSGNVYLPTTSSSIGKIVQNGVDFIHTFGSDNLFIGTPSAKAGNYTLTGTDNIAIGANVMQNLTSGSLNFGIGTNTLNALTSGQNNVGYGIACLQGITISNQNLAIGNNATRYTTGSNNIGIGYQAYQGAVGTTTGSSNICIGTQSGSAYTGAESNNIIIGSTLAGTAAESNITRIGNGQTTAFIAGNVTGSTGLTATTGNVTITSGNLSIPSTTSSVGQIVQNGNRIFHTAGSNNLFIGNSAGNFTLTGNYNCGVGPTSTNPVMASLTSGSQNTSLGLQTLNGCTTGGNNVAIGFNNSLRITIGNDNTSVGQAALSGTTTGNYNTVIGSNAGGSLGGSGQADSSNICIGYNTTGNAGVSNGLYIGNATGTGNGNINVATICGISGQTSASGVAVLINTSNVLGTTTSSMRFKENIQDMGDQSSDIYKLRPVTFTYKVSKPHVDEESSKLRQFGLIAEEVKQVMPDQVTYNLDGNIESVRYLNFIPMLINEIQKLRKEVEELRRK